MTLNSKISKGLNLNAFSYQRTQQQYSKVLRDQGRPTIWMIVGQGPIALAVGAGGGQLFGQFYSPLSFPSSFSLSLRDGPI